MTIFGPDISSFQQGLDLAALGSASFVIAKTTEGTYYTDPDYQSWRQQAAALGKPFVWYHFLSGEDPKSQVAHTAANVGDSTLPGMLDVEPTQTFRPTVAEAVAYADAAAAAGLHLRLVYLPHWYWAELGSPDLSPLAARGLHLVSSAYPGGTGSPAALYPGDGAAGWQSYGGLTPLIYQYTDKASDGGQQLDYNAFRGSPSQLIAELAITHTTAGEIDVTPEEHNWLTNLYSGEFVGGPSCGRAGAGGSNSTVAKLDWIMDALDTLANRPAPTIDPAALAAAIAPLLNASATPEAIAEAVIAHLNVTVTTK